MTEKVYDSHHGLIWKLKGQRIKILPIMSCKKHPLNFNDRHFEQN